MRLLSTSVARAVTLSVLCALSWTEAASQDLGSIEDRLLIAEQLAQYSYRWDAKDSAGFADLFTDDGVMERRRGGEVVTGSRVVGRQAILDYATSSHQGRLADRQTRHHFSALVFLEKNHPGLEDRRTRAVHRSLHGSIAARVSGPRSSDR